MKAILAAIVAVVGLLVLASCGQAPWEDSLMDLENAVVKDPDTATIYNNADKHPNLMVLCIDGVAIITTTRPDRGSWQPVPDLNKTCPQVAAR